MATYRRGAQVWTLEAKSYSQKHATIDNFSDMIAHIHWALPYTKGMDESLFPNAQPADVTLDTIPRTASTWPIRSYLAAGGVVVDGEEVLLLRRRNGEVRLPKGHLEKGETIPGCAIREVREETGLVAPTIELLLGTVENRFAQRRQRVIRREVWFLMSTPNRKIVNPEAQWIPTWYPLATAEEALTFEAERIAFRWAHAALP